MNVNTIFFLKGFKAIKVVLGEKKCTVNISQKVCFYYFMKPIQLNVAANHLW